MFQVICLAYCPLGTSTVVEEKEFICFVTDASGTFNRI